MVPVSAAAARTVPVSPHRALLATSPPGFAQRQQPWIGPPRQGLDLESSGGGCTYFAWEVATAPKPPARVGILVQNLTLSNPSDTVALERTKTKTRLKLVDVPGLGPNAFEAGQGTYCRITFAAAEMVFTVTTMTQPKDGLDPCRLARASSTALFK